MDEERLPNQFITGDASVSGNKQYLQWIESVKSRYRQSQIKAHLQVNAAVLEFNWCLGRDISEIMRTRIWGSGVVNQVSLDLKAAFPEAQGFQRITSTVWPSFTGFIRSKKKLWHKLCDNYNQLKIRQIRLWHKLCHKLRILWKSMLIVFQWNHFLTSLAWFHGDTTSRFFRTAKM